jgi:hypothetical protein
MLTCGGALFWWGHGMPMRYDDDDHDEGFKNVDEVRDVIRRVRLRSTGLNQWARVRRHRLQCLVAAVWTSESRLKFFHHRRAEEEWAQCKGPKHMKAQRTTCRD